MTEFRTTRFIIYPDDSFKLFWDIVILLLMGYTVTFTPYQVAFIETNSITLDALDYLIDALFVLDVIFNCFMAYTNKEEVLVVNHWKIFKNYLTSWMMFDLASSFPFQFIFEDSGWGTLLRLSKIPRLYRLIKVFKLFRLFKVLKNKGSFLSCLECFSRFSVGLERLVYLIFSFFIICHLFACFLYFVSSFNSDNIDNWIYKYGIQDASLEQKYLASVYWTVTILCTIGYGDVTAASEIERVMVALVELGGVFFYSYTIGTITSLMADMDKRQLNTDSKLKILHDIAQKYQLSRPFYEKLKNAVVYNQASLSSERNDLLTNLPKRLAMHLNIIMNKSLIEENRFFESKNIKFITTVISYLKPLKVKPKEIIYKKNEPTEDIYLIKTGEVLIYDHLFDLVLEIDQLNEGDYFGEIEVFLSEVREFYAKVIRPGIFYTISREELLVNVLYYFKDLQVEMIYQANLRKLEFQRRAEHGRKKSASSSTEEQPKETNTQLLNPNARYLRSENATIRKTLAPTSKAMLEENGEVFYEVFKDDIDKVAARLDRLAKVIESLD